MNRPPHMYDRYNFSVQARSSRQDCPGKIVQARGDRTELNISNSIVIMTPKIDG